MWHPSPNFGPRRDAQRPEVIVLHYTAMQSAEAALARLCDPAFEVSAHYLIAEDGRLWQMVADLDRAWHAGAGTWQGRGDVNSRAIGIELANDGAQPFSAPQMACLVHLLHGLTKAHGIALQSIIAHSDMAPDRKADPGRKFDWRGLWRAGFGVWSAAQGPSDCDFVASARGFGYPLDMDDPAQCERLLLEAFRQRFRPAASGPLDGTDRAMMRDLAERYGVDPV